MKRAVTYFILSATCTIGALADGLRFSHGPYLQNVTTDEATIFFTTNERTFSWVEIESEEWNTPRRYFNTEAGLVQAYRYDNAVHIKNLKPGKNYRYRLVSKEIKDFQPYKITYGDSIASEWYSFNTLPPKMQDCSFVIVNDIHDNAEKLRTLLELSSYEKADAIFYLGDMINHFDNPETPYNGFIDVSTELFAKNKPFIAVRGNHETRGNLARTYHNYIGRKQGEFYGIYYYGNTAIIVLDTGEDKPDTHPVYGGINRFDEYRRQQAEWLEKEIGSKRFRKTKNRIVLMHIPPVHTSRTATPEDHAVGHLAELFTPIFNKAKVDLVLSGHTHRHYFVEKRDGSNKFPVVINDHRSVAELSVNKEGIKIRITAADGNTIFDKQF